MATRLPWEKRSLSRLILKSLSLNFQSANKKFLLFWTPTTRKLSKQWLQRRTKQSNSLLPCHQANWRRPRTRANLKPPCFHLSEKRRQKPQLLKSIWLILREPGLRANYLIFWIKAFKVQSRSSLEKCTTPKQTQSYRLMAANLMKETLLCLNIFLQRSSPLGSNQLDLKQVVRLKYQISIKFQVSVLFRTISQTLPLQKTLCRGDWRLRVSNSKIKVTQSLNFQRIRLFKRALSKILRHKPLSRAKKQLSKASHTLSQQIIRKLFWSLCQALQKNLKM